jgi:hypothetical protein
MEYSDGVLGHADSGGLGLSLRTTDDQDGDEQGERKPIAWTHRHEP